LFGEVRLYDLVKGDLFENLISGEEVKQFPKIYRER
jgi:hypothetical protein